MRGTGAFAAPSKETTDYKAGYVCGVVRGDGHLASYAYHGRRRAVDALHQFRLAMIDPEALARIRRYLLDFSVETREFQFQAAVGARSEMRAIRTSARASVDEIRRIIEWPAQPGEDWSKGFLAGIFDAEGGYNQGVLRIANTDDAIVDHTTEALRRFGFDIAIEEPARNAPK